VRGEGGGRLKAHLGLISVLGGVGRAAGGAAYRWSAAPAAAAGQAGEVEAGDSGGAAR
jgi:hypothetical protein